VLIIWSWLAVVAVDLMLAALVALADSELVLGFL
jgi:hypothetical protein